MCENLHVIHNFVPLLDSNRLLLASYEGVYLSRRRSRSQDPGSALLYAANQYNPKGSRGASEIKATAGLGEGPTIATIEPWHGNQVVVSRLSADNSWDRKIIDDHLRWGHGLWFADLDGDKINELIVGVRDDPAKDDKFKERRGVRVYKCTDGKGEKWTRQMVDDGGVAVEDLTAADLDGDGKIDIIAVGRQTHNLRIYWNKGK